VAEKSNEVIAIPKLIDMLAIEGARAMWEPSICCDARLESNPSEAGERPPHGTMASSQA
jgi:predicted transposase YbfD/YdcC